MPEDSSLDAFASSEEDDAVDAEADAADAMKDATADTEADTGTDQAEPESVATETDSAASAAESVETTESVEPAVSTYAWSPEGATCTDCGESVEKRWRAEGQRDGDLVCADCKVW